ncbi:YfhE family protein [Caldibacillus thermoamylovorans]|mgnify:FL=1|jgi:hypothetical protein|nr:YfhE family protein [Caldibacillus thermoamylovorans]PAC36770.1 hypothetical protein CEJ87_05055 [Caldifermentibacillus hisashii]
MQFRSSTYALPGNGKTKNIVCTRKHGGVKAMANPKKNRGEEKKQLKKAQEIIYGRDFKRADRAARE